MLMLSTLRIQVNPKIFVKDPETSSLGRKIVESGILLIDELGFENFTFKKLGERIGSNESSIYRYFDSKHKMLVYLTCWYWGWAEYRITLATANLPDPMEKLRAAVRVVTEPPADDVATQHIDERVLYRIIVAEFTKTFHTKEVDDENKDGFFLIYKSVINRISNIVSEVDPEYPYVKSLVSTIVEGALHQHFLAGHLKTITSAGPDVRVSDFYIDLVERILTKKP